MQAAAIVSVSELLQKAAEIERGETGKAETEDLKKSLEENLEKVMEKTMDKVEVKTKENTTDDMVDPASLGDVLVQWSPQYSKATDSKTFISRHHEIDTEQNRGCISTRFWMIDRLYSLKKSLDASPEAVWSRAQEINTHHNQTKQSALVEFIQSFSLLKSVVLDLFASPDYPYAILHLTFNGGFRNATMDNNDNEKNQVSSSLCLLHQLS